MGPEQANHRRKKHQKHQARVKPLQQAPPTHPRMLPWAMVCCSCRLTRRRFPISGPAHSPPTTRRIIIRTSDGRRQGNLGSSDARPGSQRMQRSRYCEDGGDISVSAVVTASGNIAMHLIRFLGHNVGSYSPGETELSQHCASSIE